MPLLDFCFSNSNSWSEEAAMGDDWKKQNKQTLILLTWNCNWVSTEKGSYVKDLKRTLVSLVLIFQRLLKINQHKLTRFWAAPIKSPNDPFVAGLSLYSTEP